MSSTRECIERNVDDIRTIGDNLRRVAGASREILELKDGNAIARGEQTGQPRRWRSRRQRSTGWQKATAVLSGS